MHDALPRVVWQDGSAHDDDFEGVHNGASVIGHIYQTINVKGKRVSELWIGMMSGFPHTQARAPKAAAMQDSSNGATILRVTAVRGAMIGSLQCDLVGF